MLKSTRSYERDLSGRMYMTLKVGLNPPALTSGIAVHGLLVPALKSTRSYERDL